MTKITSGYLKAAFLMGSVAIPVSAQASTFDIALTFSGLTASQQSIFSTAEAFWERAITGYNSPADGSFPSLQIAATAAPIDGVGGILGSAGPSSLVIDGVSPYAWANAGAMTFDSADISALEAGGNLLAVILHEMAHVIGFGTLWSITTATGNAANTGYQEVYVDGSGQYTGAAGLAAYRVEFDPLATFVPVELDGGPGTRDGHWDETWAGGQNELMTGFLNVPTFISDTTIASFADIGYRVDLTANDVMAAVPLPPGVVLGGSAFGLMAFASRRRRSRAA